MRKPTSAVLNIFDVIQQVQTKLDAIPNIKTSMDDELLVHSRTGRKTVSVTLEFGMESDE